MSGKIDAGVQKCVAALSSAKNDTEKMAALFLVTKVVKSKDLDRESRMTLFKGIGFKFLIRLLNSPSSEDCPELLYKSVALNILTAFCDEPAIAESGEMLESIPTFLKVLETFDESGDEDDDQWLMVVSEAYNCLKCIGNTEKGRLALVQMGAIKRLSELYAKQAFNAEEGLEVIKRVGTGLGPGTWDGYQDGFNELMDKIAIQFEAETSEQKFELCEHMAGVLNSFNMTHESVDMAFWPQSILTGLVDILSSKIVEKQRNPALKLASMMMTTLGVDWVVTRSNEDTGKAYQFMVLLVHLSCIEVRMTLEDRTIEKILAKDDLIGSCYAIIEITVRLMAGNHFINLDEKQKEQVYHSLKGAFTAILGFINLVRKESERNKKFWDPRKKLLACASVRCLASWLAEESSSSSAMRDETYRQLPFVLALAFEAFEDAEMNQSAESLVLAEVGKSIEPLLPDILCMLLPALCHLTAQEKGVRILLDAKGEELLNRFLNHNWSVYKNLKEIVERKSRPKKQRKNKPQSDGKSSGIEQEINFEEIPKTLTKLRAGLNHTCNLFINITVLDPELVSINPIFQQLMRWTYTALPMLSSTEEELVLLANLTALGLLLLLDTIKKYLDAKESGKKLSPEDEFVSERLMAGTDNAVFRFGQAVVRFVWDAHLPDESQSPIALYVTSNYRSVWSDIKEMWFLCLQTLGQLMEHFAWLGDFCSDSGFLDALIGNLSKCYKNRIEQGTLAAYEDFLIAALKSCSVKSTDIVKTKGAKLAASHNLKALKKALRPEDEVEADAEAEVDADEG